jgi:uncharacterized protein (DUF1697 family)
MVYIVLFRGINVGGRALVAMAHLREVAAAAGCTEARTLLQSGNLVCRSAVRTGAGLERRIAAAAKNRLALVPDIFVRTAAEWKDVVAGNPFRQEAVRDPSHLLVVFLRRAPGPADVKALQAAIVGGEAVRARGRHAYITYPAGIGRSRLTGTLIEQKLGRGTARNWNTVLKLGTIADQVIRLKAQGSTPDD